MSTEIEKELVLAKGFLQKLITSTLDETGLMLKDSDPLFRLRNQIRLLTKAKDYCEENNIKTRKISLKLLHPLLEFSSLEEDEALLDKWAVLLANMVDSEQNIQNHLFSNILVQLSSAEYVALENTYENNREFEREMAKLIDRANANKLKIIDENEPKIKELQIRLQNLSTASDAITELRNVSSALLDLRTNITLAGNEVDKLLTKLKDDRPLEIASMNDVEFSNLIRLGVAKKEYKNINAVSQQLDLQTTHSCVITELGSMFITACNPKKLK